MKVKFKFTQTLPTHYPGLTTSAYFSGEAQPVLGGILIKNAFCQIGEAHKSLEILSGFDDAETLQMQSAATGDYGRFLALCRNAAHAALLKAGYFDPERADLSKPIMRQEMSEM